MLHLLAWLMVVASRRLLWLVPDAVTATVRGQGRVRELCALGRKLLVNAHEVALALVDQLDELVVVRLGFLAAVEGWDIGRSRCDDPPNRVA
ncbi:MAG: hypothetical protein IPI67_17110 [Myxococcales bacterium]|nr:hypothetical protein [Myxococcales bacterium]